MALGTVLERWVVGIVAGIECSIVAGTSWVVVGAVLAAAVVRLAAWSFVVDRRLKVTIEVWFVVPTSTRTS